MYIRKEEKQRGERRTNTFSRKFSGNFKISFIRKFRRTFFILAVLIFSVSLCFAETTKIKYLGPYSQEFDGILVEVGRFEVDGKTAFCIEHAKTSPPTGTDVAAQVYNNSKIKKILYYGWDGPECWRGFKSQKQGVMLTSLLLSEVYSDAHAVGTYNFVTGLKEFRSFVESKSVPDLNLRFDKERVKAYYDKVLDAERTEEIKVVGNGQGKLTIIVPTNLILYSNKGGCYYSGQSVTLSKGDSFYLRTKSGFSNEEVTTLKGRNSKLQPLVYVTSSSNLQNLSGLRMVEDTADTDKLTVEWVGFKNVSISKLDAETKKKLKGASFYIADLGEIDKATPKDKLKAEDIRRMPGAALLNADEDSYYLKDFIKLGNRYAIVEAKAPFGYSLSDEVVSFDALEDKEEYAFEFSNKKQRAGLDIKKEGTKYEICDGKVIETVSALADVEFNLFAAEEIFNYEKNEVLYNEGDFVATLKTDEKGYAKIRGLIPGKYILKEKQTLPDYILEKKEILYDLSMDPYEEEHIIADNIKNERHKTRVEINKIDKKSGKGLPDAAFIIKDENGNKIETMSDKSGKAFIDNLPDGKYTVSEITAPKGYTKSSKDYSFEIDAKKSDGRYVSLKIENEKIVSAETGDETNVLIFLAMFSLSLLTICFVEKKTL